MEKRVYDLQIDEEIKNTLPPLTEKQMELLAGDIIAHGCLDPIVVWNGVIVDGHNRYAICHENNIPFEIREIDFEDKTGAELWMLETQLGRRNMNDFCRCESVYKFQKELKEIAEKRRRERISETLKNGRMQSNLTESRTKTTREIMAGLAEVSTGLWTMAVRIIEDADEETKGQLRRSKESINKAYTDLKKTTPGTPKPKKKEKPSTAEEEFDRSDGPQMMEAPGYDDEEELDERPSNFDDVEEQFGYIKQEYLINIKESLKWIGKENAGPGTKDRIESLLKGTYEEALGMLEARYTKIMKEDTK